MASGSDCGCGSDPVMAEEAYDGPRLRMIRSGRMASATLVHIPAFAELSGHAKLTPMAGTASVMIENDGELAISEGSGDDNVPEPRQGPGPQKAQA
jgi:hypothetical protein